MYYPESFDDVAPNLTRDLSELIQDDDSLTIVIDELVDQVSDSCTSFHGIREALCLDLILLFFQAVACFSSFVLICLML